MKSNHGDTENMEIHTSFLKFYLSIPPCPQCVCGF